MRGAQIAVTAVIPLFGVLGLPVLRTLPAPAWVILGLLLVMTGVYFMGRGG